MRVALVQMRCAKGKVDANLEAHATLIREAAGRGVQAICFPEMSITGYIDPARWPGAVLTLDSAPIRRFVAMTSGNDLLAVAGLVEQNPDGKPFITQIAARRGTLTGVYRKITVIEDEEPWFSPGTGGVTVMPHEAGPIGLAICADINNPEVFARLAGAGARVIFEAAAPGLYGDQETRDWQSGFDWWRDECRTKLAGYAGEHELTICVATQAGRTIDEDFPGGGYVFGPDGRCLAETADWSAGVLDAEV